MQLTVGASHGRHAAQQARVLGANDHRFDDIGRVGNVGRKTQANAVVLVDLGEDLREGEGKGVRVGGCGCDAWVREEGCVCVKYL